jgi:RecB family endonuclease NucS
LDIDLYSRVNHILWLAYKQEEPEIKQTSSSVSLEADLRDHLAENPSIIEKYLSLVQKEYPIGSAGKADLLCRDKKGDYVVVEMKKGRESDKVVGQILRYIGGLKKDKKRARGIIIVNEPDEKLDFAIAAVGDLVKLKYYRVRFEITDNCNEQYS